MISKDCCVELPSLLVLQNGVINNFFFVLKLFLAFLEKCTNIDQLCYFFLRLDILLILRSNFFSLFLNGRYIPLIPSTFPALFNFLNLSGDDLIEETDESFLILNLFPLFLHIIDALGSIVEPSIFSSFHLDHHGINVVLG